MADTQSARIVAYSRAPFSTWLGVVFLFVLFGLIVLAVIGPSPRTTDYEEARAKKRMERLKALHEETQKDLTTYAWVDKNKGVARIPIDRAMGVTVAELAQKKPAPAGPIATPPAQTAPVGASPAPAASQRPGAAQLAPPSAAAGTPAGQGAVSTSPATQQSPPAPASPAPATTP
ncbi:MAG TPA: hypothetical protein VHT01_10230 [Candidatus Udaeobacter sp.]|nr:hypothetical protein [Candidatus Udaeobacter sp.]